MVTKNQITAYCLLAHINDNDRGISDLAQIFIPLVKKTLATLMASGVRAGNTDDMKVKFDLLFCLDIPYGLMHRFMRKIQKETNHTDKPPAIVLHDDGSFILSEFEFTELDEVMSQQSADIELIEGSYLDFIEREGLKKENEPSVFEFLDRHYQELSGFFATRTDYEPALEYTTPALFVDSVKNDDKQFNVLRRFYLGSLISSYLQLPATSTNENIKELVLDTSFLVSLLDLTSVEACHTCRKVIEIAKNLGCKITVLNITLDETRALLERCSESIDRLSITHFLNPTSIEAGCARRKLSKTGLLRIVSSLRKTLIEKHKVTVHNISTRMENKSKTSDLYKKISGRTRNPDGAHHDGIANCYVANKRGSAALSLLETQCWFVSSQNPHSSPSLRVKEDGTFFESIRAEYLLNVMWLSSPAARLQEVPTLGLSRLVASTIERSLPSHVVLRAFNENLQSLGSDELTPEDVAMVANSTAVKSARELERLNELAQTNKEQFFSDVLSIADAERERIRELEERVSKGSLLKVQAEKRQKETEVKLEKASLELHQIKSSEIDRIEGLLAVQEASLGAASRRSKLIFGFIKWLMVFLVLFIFFLFRSVIQRFNWQEIEPTVSLLFSIGPWFLTVLVYAFFGANLNSLLIQGETVLHARMIKRSGASDTIILELKEKLAILRSELNNK